jgi:hypothetical protein
LKAGGAGVRGWAHSRAHRGCVHAMGFILLERRRRIFCAFDVTPSASGFRYTDSGVVRDSNEPRWGRARAP